MSLQQIILRCILAEKSTCGLCFLGFFSGRTISHIFSDTDLYQPFDLDREICTLLPFKTPINNALTTAFSCNSDLYLGTALCKAYALMAFSALLL